MRRHDKLEEYLDANIKAAGIEGDRKGPLFRSASGKAAKLSGKPMLRGGGLRMGAGVLPDAGIETAIGCRTFRVTGITDTSQMAGVSRSRNAWPDTQMRKRPGFTTGATMTSAWAKWRGSRCENMSVSFRPH